MERNDGDTLRDAHQANKLILMEVFGAPSRMIDKADPEEVLSAAKEIHFMMQEVINPKFLEINPEGVETIEQEKSAFDEYDEENGYNEGDNNVNLWKTCRDNVERVIQICIKLMGESYQECMKADIISLLEHTAFEIRTIKK